MEVEQTEIITRNFKQHKLAILNDVYAPVAILDLKVLIKLPNSTQRSLQELSNKAKAHHELSLLPFRGTVMWVL